jgi:hypothetical protein
MFMMFFFCSIGFFTKVVKKRLREPFNSNKFRSQSMKTSIIVLYVLVSLSLLFSLTALIIVAGDNFVVFTGLGESSNHYSHAPTHTVSPNYDYNDAYYDSSSVTPRTTNSSSIDGLTLTYFDNGQTPAVFTVTLQYQGKKDITLNYSQFGLDLSAYRMGILMYTGSARAQSSGSVTLGPSHQTETIQLTI